MESTIGGEGNFFYASRVVGKRSLEWDPSGWKWDGDLFIATPLNTNSSNYQSIPLETGTPMAARVSSNSSSSCSDEANCGIHRDVSELEKRRRVTVVQDANLDDEARSLTLKPGGGTSGKNTKLLGANSNTVVCRVDDCVADLSRAKSYHRRHKVCEMHSKASTALVGNVLQRFCQQCSRFHALHEFDEGKRSCRRRLAGHNRRRRKTEPNAGVNSSSLNDNQATGYLLISLLKILSDMHSNRTNHIGDQDLLSHLLRSLASHGGQYGDKNISGLLQESQNLLNNRPSIGTSDMVSALLSNGPHGSQRLKQHCTVPASTMPHNGLHVDNARVEEIQPTSSERPDIPFPAQYCPPTQTEARDSSAGKSKLNNFDLNDVYIDSDDCIEDVERSPVLENLGAGSLGCPSWLQQGSNQSSPAQTSRNSESASSQSPSSSSGDTQSRTDRIVFKIFGKEPSDFPFVLRAQILDWLSHSPTDIESYIRPGCIILTIYLRLSESSWEELCSDLSSSLIRLLDISDDDTFWRTGWIYVLVQNQIVFMYNGQVVVDTYLPFKSNNCSTILSVKPIAISVSERAQFLVKGFNFSQHSMRLSCGVEGNYLVQETNHELVEGVDSLKGHGELQCLNFSCSIPAVTGRGFIEVEGHAFNSSFFPFIVAEKDVCLEIRMLETEIDLSETDDVQGRTGKMEARNQAMDFLYEMGWLLHRSHSKSRLGHLDPNSDLFPLKRFVWLMEFSMDHDWCSVVKKLLDILLDGTVGAGEQPFLKLALFEMGLLHRAVRRNSRPMVELLLGYVPDKVADELSSEYKSLVGADESFLFRPDVVGPAGLTPLHVAAGRDSSEDVLDAFTDDPGKVGIEAWKNAQDNTGFTPEDYARLRGYYSYIHLVQRKINRKPVTGHVALDIPSALSDCNAKQKQNEEGTASFDIGRTKVKAIKWPCKLCDQKLTYGNANRSLLHRPAMLSMVAIAAVCVCVALLFKSSPEVLYVFRPFRWEKLDFGCS